MDNLNDCTGTKLEFNLLYARACFSPSCNIWFLVFKEARTEKRAFSNLVLRLSTSCPGRLDYPFPSLP